MNLIKINGFDFLRHFAALAVLVGHCFELHSRSAANISDPLLRLTGIESLGGFGVCIFFAISGYLVTDSSLRRTQPLDFVRQRLTRVFPALLVVVLVTTFLLGPWVSSLSTSEYFQQRSTWRYLRNLYFSFQNFLPGVVSGNPVVNGLNGSLWTLPIEVKLYGIVALSMLWPAFRKPYFLIAGCLVLYFAWYHHHVTRLFITPFFRESGYLALKLVTCFSFGAILRVLTFEKKLGFILLSLASALLWSQQTNNAYTWWFFALSVSAFSLFIGLNINHNAPRLTWDISYGLYLWAFPVQQCLLHFFPKISLPTFIALTLLITAAIAALSWRWVERPAMQWLKNKPLKRSARETN